VTLVSGVLAVLALTIAVVLAVVLAATLRALDRLRRQVRELQERTRRPVDSFPEGIAVGSAAPPFSARSVDGSSFASAELDGTLRVVAFARPGCPPCEELVPDLLLRSAEGTLPPAVVVSRGTRDEQPEAWRATGPRTSLVIEEGDAISRLFDSAVAPQVFVLTPANRVGARGIATGAEDVRVLVDTARREAGNDRAAARTGT
jgi:hypothetical protein